MVLEAVGLVFGRFFLESSGATESSQPLKKSFNESVDLVHSPRVWEQAKRWKAEELFEGLVS